MTLTGFSMNTKKLSKTIENSETIAFLNKKAQQYHIAICFGMIVKNEEKVRKSLYCN